MKLKQSRKNISFNKSKTKKNKSKYKFKKIRTRTIKKGGAVKGEEEMNLVCKITQEGDIKKACCTQSPKSGALSGAVPFGAVQLPLSGDAAQAVRRRAADRGQGGRGQGGRGNGGRGALSSAASSVASSIGSSVGSFFRGPPRTNTNPAGRGRGHIAAPSPRARSATRPRPDGTSPDGTSSPTSL